MIENESLTNENKGLDVSLVILFEAKFKNLRKKIDYSINIHIDFWRELLEEVPDITKLQTLGTKIT
jgi:hypothetical protein